MTSGGKGKRSAEGRTPQRLLSTADVPHGTFAVIDPMSRKLFVPMDAMINTLAMHRAGVPSLCRLHFQGRCRQGESCHQAHADVDIVEHLRAAALAEPTCCETHGAKSDAADIPRRLTIVVTGKSEEEKILETTLAYVTVSKGLRDLVASQGLDASSAGNDASVVVPVTSLCRLHNAEACCRFGTECSFVHLCRSLVTQSGLGRRSNKAAPLHCASASVNVKHTVEAAATAADGKPAIQVAAKPVVGPATEQDLCNVDNGSLHLSSSLGFLLNRHGAGIVSLSATPKLSTSPVLSRSYNSTSSGIVWRHNPYAASSTSSVIET